MTPETDREASREVNGTSEYRMRFDQLQAEFIDEPRQAVRSAQSLVEEAVDRMLEGLRHSGADDKSDTEGLRVTMKRYRDILYQVTEEEPADMHSPADTRVRDAGMGHSPEDARVEEAEMAHSPADAPVSAEADPEDARPPA